MKQHRLERGERRKTEDQIGGLEGDDEEVLMGVKGREGEQGAEECRERKAVRQHDPTEPSEEDMKAHELTHLPFRSWCRHCVMGRARDADCREVKVGERMTPEVHADFMFMGEENGAGP